MKDFSESKQLNYLNLAMFLSWIFLGAVAVRGKFTPKTLINLHSNSLHLEFKEGFSYKEYSIYLCVLSADSLFANS